MFVNIVSSGWIIARVWSCAYQVLLVELQASMNADEFWIGPHADIAV